jgi:outer membrane protein assembly factor BamE (lipoprotein component of BamABCDE complex)
MVAMRYLLICLLLLGGAGCTGKEYLRGNMPLESQWNKITVQQTTQGEVLNYIGSPTTVATFGQNIWYYISQRKTQTAFFKPKIESLKVHIVIFGNNNIVQDKQILNEQDLIKIAYNSDETGTFGHDISVIQQLLGNIGKFNTPNTTGGAKDLLQN